MSSLSLQDIGLKPAQLRAIEKKAKDVGQSAPQYVRSLIERDLLADQSFDELLRPVREDVRKRGFSEAALEQAVRRARRAGGRQNGKGRR
jgi:hypothetical protein